MRALGPYELLGELGSGSLGQVYLGRLVGAPADAAGPFAVRVIHREIAKDPVFARILEQEAPTAKALRHPALTRLVDVGRFSEELIIVSEHIDGCTLAKLLERSKALDRPISGELAVWMIASVAEGLAIAEETTWAPGESAGVLHGTITPESIYLTRTGRVKLSGVGWGRARLSVPPTRAKLPYRAPEVFEQRRIDGRADVYALGLVMHSLLTLECLFARETVGEIKAAVLVGVAPEVMATMPTVSPSVSALVTSMMARYPPDRPQRLAEVARALRATLVRPDDEYAREAASFRRAVIDEGSVVASQDSSPTEPEIFTSGSLELPVRPALPRRQSQPYAFSRNASDGATSDKVTTAAGDRGKSPSIERALYADDDHIDSVVDAIVAAGPESAAPRVPRSRSNTPLPREMDVEHDAFDVDKAVAAIVAASRRDEEARMVRQARLEQEARAARGQRQPEDEGQPEYVSIPTIPSMRQPFEAPSVAAGRPPPVDTTEDILALGESGYGPGDIISERYRIIEPLGEGGMAVVYRVEHTLLLKHMALKLLRPELSSMPYAVQRFQREARAVCLLDSPHIVRVTDFGRADNGSLYLVMDYLEGKSLSLVIANESPLPYPSCLRIIDEILGGLEHAHEHNVVHRDLKPDNIMLVRQGKRQTTKILDFGIMKLTRESVEAVRPITEAGMIFGTPRYMSPEQASGEEVDHRTDIYSVGVIMYELLTGIRPFDGSKPAQILTKVLTQEPEPMQLSGLEPSVATELEQVVLRAMAKDAEDRFETASEFRAAVKGCRAFF